MTTMQLVVSGIITVIVAVGGWVVAVVVRREQSRADQQARSGTIRTSEAADLWAESTKIREYLSKQLAERDAEIERLDAEVVECRKACEVVRQEAMECRQREKILEGRLAAAGL